MFKPNAVKLDPLSEEFIPPWRMVKSKEGHHLIADTLYMVRQQASNEVVFYFFRSKKKEKKFPQPGFLFLEDGIRVDCTVPSQYGGSDEIKALGKILKIEVQDSVRDHIIRECFLQQHPSSTLGDLKPESSVWKPRVKIKELEMSKSALPSQNPHK